MKEFINPLVALHDITLTLLTEEDPEVLLNTILDQAIDYTDADSGSIALLDPSRKYLEIKVFRGLEKDTPEKVKLKLGEGVTGRCILTGKLRNVGNVSEDPYYISIRPDLQSELAIPLKAGNKSFGVISVDSSKQKAFNTNHEEYLSMLANYAAQIFTNQESIRHLIHRQFIQDILIEISTLLGKYPDFKTVFEESIHLLEKKIGLLRGAIYLFDNIIDELRIVNSINYTEIEIERSHYKKGEGITGSVYSSGRAMAIPDINQDQTFLNKSGIARSDQQTSFFSTPIYVHEKIVGVINIEVPFKNNSNFSDLNFLITMLSTLLSQAINIHNLIQNSNADIQSKNILLKQQFDNKYSFENIVGKSESMQKLFHMLKMSADSNSTVLITGESGTGKELFATALHRNSRRSEKNMVKINCAAIPADLLESELFGYSKGAFTGAEKDYTGKILSAHEGTLFLDEIGEMDIKLQSKLLRFLQDKEFSPLGSNKVYKVNVRIIAATNADLESMIARKLFREDLYYRLNVLQINIPPLRERMEDLYFLVEYLLNKISENNYKSKKTVSPEALRKLEHYPFPGNVRELENILERAAVLSYESTIHINEIILSSKSFENKLVYSEEKEDISSNESSCLSQWISEQIENENEEFIHKKIINIIDKELINQILKKTFYNKSKTARILGLNRITLDKRLKELNLN